MNHTHQTVADALKDRIAKGRWKYPDTVTNLSLQRRYGISAAVAERAVELLRAEGLVETRAGAGTRPKPPASSEATGWSTPPGGGTQIAHITQTLRERITSGTYAPAKRLPARVALAKEFRVSVTTVNRVMAYLIAERLVIRHTVRGGGRLHDVVAKKLPGSTPAEKTAADLRNRIETGAWQPGENITQKNLVGWYEISIVSAQMALEMLCADGLIRSRPGIGSTPIGSGPPHGISHTAHIARIVRDRIADRTYPSGSFLPQTSVFIAEFGVSRVVIQNALRSLGPLLHMQHRYYVSDLALGVPHAHGPGGVPPVEVLPPDRAYDWGFHARRLADPSLLDTSIALKVSRDPLLAVPVGGCRRGGFFVVADHEDLRIATAVRAVLTQRPGYPQARVRWVPEPDCYAVVEWGSHIPQSADRADRGRFYGYHDRALTSGHFVLPHYPATGPLPVDHAHETGPTHSTATGSA